MIQLPLKLLASPYRNKGYNFTITSSTAYDQKWMRGRNFYENIDRVVDSVFANYLSRPGVRQPIFTSYCDGRRVTCNGLSQWGSKYLGEEGYSAIDIIDYYYGSDMYINTAESIAGVIFIPPFRFCKRRRYAFVRLSAVFIAFTIFHCSSQYKYGCF